MLATGLVGVGCGSGSNDKATASSPGAASTSTSPRTNTTTTAASPASSQLIAGADAICRRLNVEFSAKPPTSASISEIARVSPGRAVLERRAANELGRLKAPPSIARDWKSLVADRESLAAELAEAGAAAKRGDGATIAKLAKSKAGRHQRMQALAQQLGLKDCAQIG